MRTAVNILVIEDLEEDYELLLRHLKKGWKTVNAKRIDTPEEFEKELNSQHWDAILSDNALPRFDASTALRQLQAKNKNIPFIIVSGTITDELAVNAMRNGANDYILKDNYSRLIPALEREIRDHKIKKKYEDVEKALSISQHRYELLANNIQDLVALHKPDSTYLWIAPSAERILGYQAEELVGKKHFEFIHPEDYDPEEFNDPFDKQGEHSLRRFTYRIKRKDGTYIYVETLLEPIRENGSLTQILSTSRDITEQKMAYDLLTESQERYYGVINTIAEGVILYNHKGEIITYNPSAERLLGITIGNEQDNKNLLADKYDLIRADNTKFPLNEFPSLITQKTGKPCTNVQMGLRAKNRTGDVTWISINSVPFKEPNSELGVVVSFSDITFQKTSEDQTAAAAIELRSLIDTANAPIFGIDWNGRINEWNLVCSKVTGYKKEEVYGKSLISEFILDGYKVSVTDLLKSALRGKAVTNYELPIYTRTGQVVTILFNATPRKDVDGNIIGVLGVGQDITELIQYRDKLEQRVSERTKELHKSLEKQKELVAIKSKFVSMASHEFRTPLSTISFAADFIRKYADRLSDKERNKKLAKIEEQVKHMTMLLDDVLVMGKSEAGKIKVNPVSVNIKSFVKKLVEEVEHSAHNTHKVMVSVASESKGILVDEKLLRNILINLLSNAIKFSPGQNKVLLDVIYRNKTLNIKVKDWGMGIEEEDRDKIFEAFHRSNAVGAIQGTGLGLAIVKKAIDMHGGSIKVDTELGKGTTFNIEMPLDYENIAH